MAINLKSVFWVTKYGIPHLQRAGGGSIILVGSVSDPRVVRFAPWIESRTNYNRLSHHLGACAWVGSRSMTAAAGRRPRPGYPTPQNTRSTTNRARRVTRR